MMRYVQIEHLTGKYKRHKSVLLKYIFFKIVLRQGTKGQNLKNKVFFKNLESVMQGSDKQWQNNALISTSKILLFDK